MENQRSYAAFVGARALASGTQAEVLTALKAAFDRDRGALFLIFEDQTGKQVDFDLRGTLKEVLARYETAPARVGPGRPKLGVVAREISLLPRHWEWLEQQPSGASAAIRRLVDEARKREPGEQQTRLAIEAAGRVLTALAGDLPGYEEAGRALYARDRVRFNTLTRNWPDDVRTYLQRLAHGIWRLNRD